MVFKDDPRIVDTVRRKIDIFYQQNPMLETMGITVTSFTFGEVRLDADATHNLTNVYGIAHGGLSMVLADTAMGGASSPPAAETTAPPTTPVSAAAIGRAMAKTGPSRA